MVRDTCYKGSCNLCWQKRTFTVTFYISDTNMNLNTAEELLGKKCLQLDYYLAVTCSYESKWARENLHAERSPFHSDILLCTAVMELFTYLLWNTVCGGFIYILKLWNQALVEREIVEYPWINSTFQMVTKDIYSFEWQSSLTE